MNRSECQALTEWDFMRGMKRGAIPFLRIPSRIPCFIDVHFSLSIGTHCFMGRGADICSPPYRSHCKDTGKCEDMGHCARAGHLYSSLLTALAEVPVTCITQGPLPLAPDTVDWTRDVQAKLIP